MGYHGLISEDSTLSEIDVQLQAAQKLTDFFSTVVEAMLVHSEDEVKEALAKSAYDAKGVLDGKKVPAEKVEAMNALLPAFGLAQDAWSRTIRVARENVAS